MSVAGLLLAAGSSRRLGEPKQLLADAAGQPLVRRAAQQLLDAGCIPVLVVVGAAADRVREALVGLPVRCVENPAYTEGMGTSIAAGVRAISTHRVEKGQDSFLSFDDGAQMSSSCAILIAACDMPDITVGHLSALLARSANGTLRVASAYPTAVHAKDDAALVRGIPAVLPQADWPLLASLNGDRGARDVLRASETLTVFVRTGSVDLDTPDDVAAWRASG